MKKLILFTVLFLGCINLVNAQEASKEPIGLNFQFMPGESPEIVGMEEECRNPETGEGTCKVTIIYNREDTLLFPMYFIQDGDTLEYISSADSATGWETVQGVKFTLLPNGVPTYLLEIRNLYGGSYVYPDMPKL